MLLNYYWLKYKSAHAVANIFLQSPAHSKGIFISAAIGRCLESAGLTRIPRHSRSALNPRYSSYLRSGPTGVRREPILSEMFCVGANELLDKLSRSVNAVL